ncbi:hypothetical protein ACO0RG_000584 [Hanseniaspora osmophila]
MGNSSSKPSSGSSSKSSKLNKSSSSNKKTGSSNISSNTSTGSTGKKTGLLNKRKGTVQPASGLSTETAPQPAQKTVNTISSNNRETHKNVSQAGNSNIHSTSKDHYPTPNNDKIKQHSTTEQGQRPIDKDAFVNSTADSAVNAAHDRTSNTTEPSKSYQRHKRSKSTGSIPSSEISAEVAKHKSKTPTMASKIEVTKMKNFANVDVPSEQEIKDKYGEDDEDDDEEDDEDDEDEDEEASTRHSQEKLANRTSSSSSKKSGSIFNKRPSSSSATLSPPPLSKASSFSKSVKSSRKSSFDQTLPPSMVTIKPSTSILKKNPSRHSMSSSAYYSDNALTDDETDPSTYHGNNRRSFDSSRRHLSSSSRRSSSTSVVSGTTGNMMNNGAGNNATNSPYNSARDRNSSFGDNNDFQNLADPLSRTSTRNSGNSVSNNTINSTGSGSRIISSTGNGGNLMGSRKSSFSSLKSTGKTAYSTPAGSPGIEMYQSGKAGEGDYFNMNEHAPNNEGGNTIPGAYSQISGHSNGEQQVAEGETSHHPKYAHSHVEPDLSQLDPEERELFLAQMQRVDGSVNNASNDHLEGSSQTHHRYSKQYGAEDLARTADLGSSGIEKKTIKRPLKPLNVDITIQKLLDAGYSGKRTKNLVLKNSEIQQICSIARDIFLQQPPLLELSPPVKIVGDVHGQFQDLIRMFDKCGFPPSANYLFLGDYVDRGKQSLETILLLLCFKIKYPENFFLLRGNHECASVTRVYGFYDECKRRCNIKTWKLFVDTFNTLPLAAIVAGKIFCVHGGLSPVLNSMDEIRHVSRPTDVPDFGLINDLLWSDPTDSINEWEDNERGVSYCYNKVAINKFLNRFGFDLVCRAHMVVEDGYEFFNAHTLVTVFSAPNYCGEFDNWGAVMSVSDALLCSFELLEPLDSAALKQVMKKGRQERKQAALQAAEFEQQELQELQQQQQTEDRVLGNYRAQDAVREKNEIGQPEPTQA